MTAKPVKFCLDDFIGKPCASSASFEFKPKKKMELNLLELAASIERQEITVETKNEFFLSINVNGVKLSLFKSGKMLVKDGSSEKAKKTVKELINAIHAN